MCISEHCHEVTGFLLWIGTYCISCVVQQRSRVKDLLSLVGYDDSCLAAIRHVKSIIRVVKLRPNIRFLSVLFTIYKKKFRKFWLRIFVRNQAGKRDYLFRISVCPWFFSSGTNKKIYLFCKHWFTSSVCNFCHWDADVPPCETSRAARCEEKRLFSQATDSAKMDKRASCNALWVTG